MTQTIETTSANDHTYSFEQLTSTDPEHFIPLHQTPLDIGHAALSHEIATASNAETKSVPALIDQDTSIEPPLIPDKQENFSLLFPIGFLLADNRTGAGLPAEGDDTLATRLLLVETADGAETLIDQLRKRQVTPTGDETIDIITMAINTQEADHAAMQLSSYYLKNHDSDSARRIAETIEDPIKGLRSIADIERYVADHHPQHQHDMEGLVEEIKERVAEITGESEYGNNETAIDKLDRFALAALHAAAEAIDDPGLALATEKAYHDKELPQFTRYAA